MAETMQLTVSWLQAIISIVIGITVLLTVGITVGRVLESIKNNRAELASSLDTFRRAISDMVEGLVSRVELAEAYIDDDTRRRENYRMWRISKNREVRRVNKEIATIQHRLDLLEKSKES